jgi:hypothetical protein
MKREPVIILGNELAFWATVSSVAVQPQPFPLSMIKTVSFTFNDQVKRTL